MNFILNRKSILKKTIQVAFSTVLSRVLGLLRHILLLRYYIPVGMVSDSFLTAFKIPNFFRKIFAEGALSATFTPTITQVIKKESVHEANRLMTLSFIFFEGIVLLLCLGLIVLAKPILVLVAPGFTAEQLDLTASFLRIMAPFIFFQSSSALLGGALQAINHFLIPAFAPIIINVVFIISILICWLNSLPVTYLCLGVTFGGFLQFAAHVIAYFRLGFRFERIDEVAVKHFKAVLKKFLPCFISASFMELNLFVATSFATLFPKGVTIIELGARFMGIALGVFAIAFSTILLPHFSRITTYAPKRLNFYLFEAAKLTFLITIPVTLIMSFFAKKIFITLFYNAKNFPMSCVDQAAPVLIVFLMGLFFFSINKILLNIYYSMHKTFITAVIAIVATIINIGLNIIFTRLFSLIGITIATTISGIIETIFLVFFLHTRYNFNLYLKKFFIFMCRCLLQTAVIIPLFFLIYEALTYVINLLPLTLSNFLLNKVGLWLWVGPLLFLMALLILATRKKFKIKLHFLG